MTIEHSSWREEKETRPTPADKLLYILGLLENPCRQQFFALENHKLHHLAETGEKLGRRRAVGESATKRALETDVTLAGESTKIEASNKNQGSLTWGSSVGVGGSCHLGSKWWSIVLASLRWGRSR